MSAPSRITIAFEQEPDQASSLFSNMSFAGWLDQMTGAGLGKWDDKSNFVPELATEIPTADNGDVSADGLTVTWKLKPCLFWSDGQPLTSKDIAFTWKAVLDPANQPISRAGWDKITRIDTPDDQTAVLHFSTLYPAWPTLFTVGPNNLSEILPEHMLTGQDRTGEGSRDPSADHQRQRLRDQGVGGWRSHDPGSQPQLLAGSRQARFRSTSSSCRILRRVWLP